MVSGLHWRDSERNPPRLRRDYILYRSAHRSTSMCPLRSWRSSSRAARTPRGQMVALCLLFLPLKKCFGFLALLSFGLPPSQVIKKACFKAWLLTGFSAKRRLATLSLSSRVFRVFANARFREIQWSPCAFIERLRCAGHSLSCWRERLRWIRFKSSDLKIWEERESRKCIGLKQKNNKIIQRNKKVLSLVKKRKRMCSK